ncbi:NADPH:quinone oxidoreductase [Salix suchowensis]|nr:NADPH:quinone oxidoreductase [Salix suchowensis]
MEAVASKPVIKAVALCGSLRKGSFTMASFVLISKDGMEIEYIDISPLPVLNTDLEVDYGTFPPVVEAFRQKILQADSVLSASPEYNYSVTASPLKNAIVSMELLTTSFTYCIEIYLDLHFINKPEFHLNAFAPPAKFDSDGNLIDPQSKNRLKEVLLSLFAFTSRLKGNC